MKKTTVDMLVTRAHIPKGTFYLFYESKEALLFQALLGLHEQIETELNTQIQQVEDKRDVEAVTAVILFFFRKADESGMLRMMAADELTLLVQKLPKKMIMDHLESDHDMILTLFEQLAISPKKEIASYAAAFRSLFTTLLHKAETGETETYDALYLCIRGLVLQMME
nr:TetR/AcrR family transcriptional regulator [Enterococcus sp. 9E7_DIV0242]